MYPLEEAKNQITKILEKILIDFGCKSDIKIETPKDEKMGDFAFPCFQLAPIIKKSPKNIAEIIKSKIKNDKWIKKN